MQMKMKKEKAVQTQADLCNTLPAKERQAGSGTSLSLFLLTL